MPMTSQFRRSLFHKIRILTAAVALGVVCTPLPNADALNNALTIISTSPIITRQSGIVKVPLSGLFPTATSATLGTFSSVAGNNSISAQANYKTMMSLCRVYGAPAVPCNGLAAFGTVNSASAPESQRAMNRMVTLNPLGARRYVDVDVSGGNVSFPETDVRQNEIGFVNVSYYEGQKGMPFNRCDAEIIACGSEVVGCPIAQKSASCTPVVASNTFVNANCECRDSSGQPDPTKYLASCINNVPVCNPIPPQIINCPVGQIADGGICKYSWSCNSLTPAESATRTNVCDTTTLSFDRSLSVPAYFPSTLYCSGTMACPANNCQAGNYVSGQSCSTCAPGNYAPSTNMNACISCPAGSIAPAPGAATCNACPAGSSSLDGLTCTPCAAGTYQSTPGSATCAACPNATIPGAGTVSTTSPAGASTLSQCSTRPLTCVAGYSVDPTGTMCNPNPGASNPPPGCNFTLTTYPVQPGNATAQNGAINVYTAGTFIGPMSFSYTKNGAPQGIVTNVTASTARLSNAGEGSYVITATDTGAGGSSCNQSVTQPLSGSCGSVSWCHLATRTKTCYNDGTNSTGPGMGSCSPDQGGASPACPGACGGGGPAKLVYNVHDVNDCTVGGGTVVQGPLGLNEQFCKFSFPTASGSTNNSCPSGWTNYNNYRATEGRFIPVTYVNGGLYANRCTIPRTDGNTGKTITQYDRFYTADTPTVVSQPFAMNASNLSSQPYYNFYSDNCAQDPYSISAPTPNVGGAITMLQGLDHWFGKGLDFWIKSAFAFRFCPGGNITCDMTEGFTDVPLYIKEIGCY
ncbi:MAG: hypothetical protein H7301_01120 [Cryobacterium sp.]|nr:hypothetical protein [Oligoflexia bacterium]